jgi:hypothetical protein
LSEKKYEFLKELVRNVSDVQPIEDDQERTKTRELPTGQRTRGRFEFVLSFSRITARIYVYITFVDCSTCFTARLSFP